MDNENRASTWREGQVTISTVMGYKIAIEGQASDGPGLLSIGALYTTEGYCSVLPSTANKACNEILINNTGLIISPYYPGFYNNNASCTWTIKAKERHVIRLEIKEFELEMSPRCLNDFVKVYDGDLRLDKSRIGTYCGIKYPQIIQSTTNNMLIVFQSNAEVVRLGFMARYRILKDHQNDTNCVQDCPADCMCRKLPADRGQGIVVYSHALHSIPLRFPEESVAILFSGNKIVQLEYKAFSDLPKLSFIDMSFNKIIIVKKKAFFNLPSLKALRLNINFIKAIEDDTWFKTPNLKHLDIGDNLIDTIGSKAFLELKDVEVMSLRRNKIKRFDVNVFQNNTYLTYLYLHENVIEDIPSGVFRNQKHLKTLTLHANKLQKFERTSFKGLLMLENLTLDRNPIKESKIPTDAFKELSNLKYLTLDSFILCCYAKETIPSLTCTSQGNSFSSCEDMLKRIVIRIAVWIQGIFACFGNLAVIIWWTVLASKKKTKNSKKTDVQSFLLSNLALADFLMGVYLLIIAVQNTTWKGEYFKHDVDWRSGIMCQITGGIATLSSEVSVMTLVLLTADRFNTIVFDFRAKRLGVRTAKILCLLVWVAGFVIAFVPLLVTSYFNDQKTGFSFYGRSTVCLPLQLSSDQPAGWEYSVAVFMVFNAVVFLFILAAYTAILVKVRRSAKRVQSTRKSSSLGKRVLFVVLTDFFCWMPVIAIGALSLMGLFEDPTGQVYAWIAVFVLPINSSINPILYTFATPQVMRRLQSIKIMPKKNRDNEKPCVAGAKRKRGDQQCQSNPQEQASPDPISNITQVQEDSPPCNPDVTVQAAPEERQKSCHRRVKVDVHEKQIEETKF